MKTSPRDCSSSSRIRPPWLRLHWQMAVLTLFRIPRWNSNWLYSSPVWYTTSFSYHTLRWGCWSIDTSHMCPVIEWTFYSRWKYTATWKEKFTMLSHDHKFFTWVSLILKRKAEATKLIRRSARSKCSNSNRGNSSVGSRHQFHQLALQQLSSDHQPFLLTKPFLLLQDIIGYAWQQVKS